MADSAQPKPTEQMQVIEWTDAEKNTMEILNIHCSNCGRIKRTGTVTSLTDARSAAVTHAENHANKGQEVDIHVEVKIHAFTTRPDY